MALEPTTETKVETETTTRIKLDPPEALQAVPIHEASGLVPLKKEETSELDDKVEIGRAHV